MHLFDLFLLAVLEHWIASFGGIVLVGFAIYEKYWKKLTPSRWYWGLAALFFFVATFQAWKDEYAKTHPGFSVEVDGITIGGNSPTGRADIYVWATLSNSGVPSVADNWNLSVKVPGSKVSVMGMPQEIDPKYGLSVAGPDLKPIFSVDPSDALYKKTLDQPVVPGMKDVGFLWFTVPLTYANAHAAGAAYVLECTDAFGNVIHSKKWIEGSHPKGSGQVPYHPGMKN